MISDSYLAPLPIKLRLDVVSNVKPQQMTYLHINTTSLHAASEAVIYTIDSLDFSVTIFVLDISIIIAVSSVDYGVLSSHVSTTIERYRCKTSNSPVLFRLCVFFYDCIV